MLYLGVDRSGAAKALQTALQSSNKSSLVKPPFSSVSTYNWRVVRCLYFMLREEQVNRRLSNLYGPGCSFLLLLMEPGSAT